jgi:hypothetical protein
LSAKPRKYFSNVWELLLSLSYSQNCLNKLRTSFLSYLQHHQHHLSSLNLVLIIIVQVVVSIIVRKCGIWVVEQYSYHGCSKLL